MMRENTMLVKEENASGSKRAAEMGIKMDFQILDMAGARPEHSTVIVNFVAAIREQLLHSTLSLIHI